MRTAQMLDHTLKAAGLPIDGISIGKVADRSTWTVQWASPPTPDQQRQADQLLAGFVPVADVGKVADLTAESVLAWCAGKFGVDVMEATLEVVTGLSVKP